MHNNIQSSYCVFCEFRFYLQLASFLVDHRLLDLLCSKNSTRAQMRDIYRGERRAGGGAQRDEMIINH